MATEKRVFTVKKTLGGAQTYRKWEDYAIGDVVIGEFVGTHIDQFKKTNYKIKLLDATFEDQELAESLIGKVLVLNSAGSLDKQMEEVSEGETISMEYTGKVLLVKGPFAGKEAHTMAVSIVEMSNAPAVSNDGL
jgi:hypothetical protein